MGLIDFDTIDYECLYSVDQDRIFNIEKKIGFGKFGKVYMIARKSDNYKFALKIFRVNNKSSQNEVDHLKEFNGQDIIFPHVSYIFKCLFNFYVIMELLTGPTVDHNLLKEHKISVNRFVEMIYRILKGLEMLHDKYVMYNDLKPQNIMLDDELNPRLLDFGLTTKFNDCDQTHYGTPIFMPPESFEDIISNEKKDIWSFGLTVFELITGYNIMGDIIFVNETTNKLEFYKNELDAIIDEMDLIFDEEVDKIKCTKYEKQILYNMYNVIKNCLNLDPNDRISVKQILEFMNSQVFSSNTINVRPS